MTAKPLACAASSCAHLSRANSQATQVVESGASIAHFPIRPAILKPRYALDIRGAGVTKGRAFVVEDYKLSQEARTALSQRAYLIQEYKLGVGEGIFGIAHD